jgi:hypothetical protein
MRRLLVLCGLLALMLAPSVPAVAQVPVSVLISDPAQYKGTVTVQGELVGDYGYRSDGTVWTQLNDDSYAREPLLEGGERTGGNVGIGVRIPADLVAGLDPPGGYRKRGPLVQLTGQWEYHDPDRGGESYLDVTELVLIEPGREFGEGISYPAVIIGAALIAAAGVLWLRRPRSG